MSVTTSKHNISQHTYIRKLDAHTDRRADKQAINDKVRENEDAELDVEVDLEDSSGDQVEEDESWETAKKPSHPLQKVYAQIETYMSQVFSWGSIRLNTI